MPSSSWFRGLYLTCFDTAVSFAPDATAGRCLSIIPYRSFNRNTLSSLNLESLHVESGSEKELMLTKDSKKATPSDIL